MAKIKESGVKKGKKKEAMSKDKIGIMLSVGCMVHCILTPLILPLLPLIGFTFKHSPWIHIMLALIIGVIAYITFDLGFKKHHSPLPMLLAMAGVPLLFIGGFAEMNTISEPISIFFTLVGSIILIIAHYSNHHLLCTCGCKNKV